jgi:hypothetical protein
LFRVICKYCLRSYYPPAYVAVFCETLTFNTNLRQIHIALGYFFLVLFTQNISCFDTNRAGFLRPREREDCGFIIQYREERSS